MKNIFVLFVIILGTIFLHVACDPEKVLGGTEIESENEEDSSSTKTESSSDYIWDTSDLKTITLNGSLISSSSPDVKIDGTTATISAGGCYSISGNLTNGQLIVDAPSSEIKIQLNAVSVLNSTSSPFYIKKASKVIVFLAEGTINSFTDATTYSNSDEEPNSCIFSNAYLAFTGTGTLNVTGKHADGISSDDQIIINNGNINVTAVDDGIRGKDYLVISNGTILSTCNTGHALKSDNTDAGYGYIEIDGGKLTLASTSGKGIKAVNKYTQDGGDIVVTKSVEGIESYSININDGSLDITASNDGVNTTKGTVNGGTEQNDGGCLYVRGGTLIASCTNGDAIDSNGDIVITGGLTIANGPSSETQEAADFNGTFNMNGGIFIGAGSNSNMTKPMSSSSTQPNMYISSNSQISSSTFLNIKINSTDVIAFKPKYGAYKFLISTPEMSKGASYSIYTGGSYSATSNIGGYFSGGTYTPGTLKKSGTLSTSSSVNSISF
ncbi:MAG: carbohydrate-binding domain-containing protein [Paludibacteraceae bacterium]|nr:carbohydrate-binding domain-containing protein [Paludibacteraceae bacterium]